MDEFRDAFKFNLKSLMQEYGVSQHALAKAVDVDQTTISAWLRGESEPTLSKICLLMEYFACSFEDLID